MKKHIKHVKENIELLKISDASISFVWENTSYLKSYSVQGDGGQKLKAVGMCTSQRGNTHFVVEIATRRAEGEVAVTIAHELRHVWQYTNKLLTMKKGEDGWKYSWRGNAETPQVNFSKKWAESEAYYNNPEEIDARWWGDYYWENILGKERTVTSVQWHNYLFTEVF